MPFYHWQGEDLLLDCHLQPGAKRAEFAGQHGERLKIRISAPPIDGKANEALIRFLADAFAVSRQQVSLLSGQSSRQKRLLIQTPRQLPTELGIQRR
ncbi:MAG: YggU family protein [Pseudomonadales bacterium]|nr:YggU family protein [Pseudomonadales bacterium]|tara:strand:+ start:153 stop:443 length:291 start_codon:yes stop_codon:yes gene_type:complete